MAEFKHIPVMLPECLDALAIHKDGVYVDGTAGGGSHSAAIADAIEKAGGGQLICIDRDDAAIKTCTERFADKRFVRVVKDNFANLGSVLDGLGIEKIDGLLLDLGVSSYQLDTADRGFSYKNEADLDMRMDTEAPIKASDVVNGYPFERLKRVIEDYGEEKFASRIASAIAEKRTFAPITTTTELAELVKSAIPAAAARGESQHPARRTFQAIRIEVNGELDAIAPALTAATERLNVGGRIAVITFHSLEDRIVKQTFAELAQGCTCPKDFPVCICGNKPKIRHTSKKPVLPDETELEINPRSHSAKLRAAEKL